MCATCLTLLCLGASSRAQADEVKSFSVDLTGGFLLFFPLVSVHGHDLHGFSCHDCRHVFYLRAADLQRECDKMRGTVRPRQPKNRPKN